MYVGWTLFYVGVTLLSNVGWFLVTLPAVLAATHRTVMHEERELERTFGDEYRGYRETVVRYLPLGPGS